MPKLEDWDQDLHAEYLALLHAMQSGVAMMQHYERDTDEKIHKHLRVGVNSTLISASTLAELLISKGVITAEEYQRALVEKTREEVDSYRAQIANATGVSIDRIKLG